MKRKNIKHHLFMRNYRKRLILFSSILCMLLASLQSFASEDPTNTSCLRGSVDSFAVGKEITTMDQNFYDTTIAKTIAHTYKIQDVVSLGIDELGSSIIQSDFDVTVALAVTRYDSAGNTITDTQNLRVCYKIADTAKNKILSYFSFTGAYKVDVKIISITPATGVSWDYTKLLFLKNDITAIRDYVFQCSSVMPLPSITTPSIVNPDNRKMFLQLLLYQNLYL